VKEGEKGAEKEGAASPDHLMRERQTKLKEKGTMPFPWNPGPF